MAKSNIEEIGNDYLTNSKANALKEAETDAKRLKDEREAAFNECFKSPDKFPSPEQIELIRQYFIRKRPFTKEDKQLLSGWNKLVNGSLTDPIKRIIATDFGGKLADWKKINQTAWIEQGNPRQRDKSPSTVPQEPANENGEKTISEPIKPPLKVPSQKAKAAWMLQEFQGIKKQSEIARVMTEKGLKTDQPAVSRLLKEFHKYLKDGGIAPKPPKAVHVETVDPAVLDMGSRKDGRTERQRQKKSE